MGYITTYSELEVCVSPESIADVMRLLAVVDGQEAVARLAVVHLQREVFLRGSRLPSQVQAVDGGFLQHRRGRLARWAPGSGIRHHVGVRAMSQDKM